MTTPADPSTWKLPRLRIDREGAWFHEDEEITHAIAAVWTERTDRYSDLRSEETAGLHKIEMSFIGG